MNDVTKELVVAVINLQTVGGYHRTLNLHRISQLQGARDMVMISLLSAAGTL